MKWFLPLVTAIILASAAAANFSLFQVNGLVGACQTLGTLTCDANGWTQFSVGPGGFCEGNAGGCVSPAANQTRIIYVAASPTGNDANPGTFASPVATPIQALSMVRNGSPDWILLRCGDTWTDASFGQVNFGGLNANNPFLISNYDGGAGHNPPVPDPSSCSALPVLQTSSTWVNGAHGTSSFSLGGNASYFAAVGFVTYAYTRDPANGSFTLAEAAVNSPGTNITSVALHDVLLEDVTIKFFVQNLTFCATGASNSSNYIKISNFYLRRSRILSGYPSSSFAAQGVLACQFANGPNGYVFYENIIDHNGWNQDNAGINWAAPSGRAHNIYSSQFTVNGDLNTTGTAGNFQGNVLSNDGGATLFEVGGIIQNNFCMLSPYCFVIGSIAGYPSVTSGNVIISPDNTAANGGANSMGYGGRGFLAVTEVGGPGSSSNHLTGNIVANSAVDPAAFGYASDPGGNALTSTGNILYNWGRTNPTFAFTHTEGSLLTQHPSNQGTGYADNSVAISAASSSNSSGNIDGQDYIVVTVANTTGIPTTASRVMFKKTSGALQGPYTAANIDATHLEIYGTNYTNFGGTTFTGTLYFPWFGVTLTNVSAHCTTQPTADLISVGGNIVYVGYEGADGPSEYKDAGGANCQAGDTLSATPGSTCSNPGGVCTNGFSWNGSANVGSGLVITLDSVTNNTIGTLDTTGPCSLPTHNVVDTGGTNFCNFTDPNRTPGSYYSTLAGATANATFTASVDGSGTMNVTAVTSGTLNIGDAIKWSGQTKADFIKGTNAISNSLCSTPPCTGTGTTGTYALSGINISVGSQSMSSYRPQQLLALMRAQTKPTWNTNFTACAVNKYIKAGFGITDTCNVNQ